MEEIEDAILVDDYEEPLEKPKVMIAGDSKHGAGMMMASMMAMAGSAIIGGGSAMNALGLKISKGKTGNKYASMTHYSGTKEIERRKKQNERNRKKICN